MTEYVLADDRTLFHLFYLIMKGSQYFSGGSLSLESVYISNIGVDWLRDSDDLCDAADTLHKQTLFYSCQHCEESNDTGKVLDAGRICMFAKH